MNVTDDFVDLGDATEVTCGHELIGALDTDGHLYYSVVGLSDLD